MRTAPPASRERPGKDILVAAADRGGNDIIAAIATAPGASALGVVRLSGPGTLAAAGKFLKPAELSPRHAALRRAFDAEGTIDQVVATFFPGPDSATGEDLLEVSAHGSAYILQRLLAAAMAAGARLALPGEFTQRAFVNGRLDLSQAEAVCDLIGARTARAHREALTRLEGGLSRALAACRAPIVELLVQIEARLDHPEEDIPPLPEASALAALETAAARIERLAATQRAGRLLAEGPRVAIVGRPNAGKSSLLNALLGSDRAIVCAEPGTTRDTLEEPCDLDGLGAVLVDTAGLREDASDAAEREGVERTRRALRGADLALLVVDGGRPEDSEDRRLHREVLEAAAREGRPLLSALSKADLPRRSAFSADVAVSAARRAGLDELRERIARAVAPAPGHGEESVTVNSLRHREALERAAAELRGAARDARGSPGRWEDLAASRLREALRALDEIAGAGTPDEVLREIFKRFCVGK